MGMHPSLPLLAYALPVLRLLGPIQIEVPFEGTILPGSGSQPLRCTPPCPEGLPEGLAALLKQTCREVGAGSGSLFIHVSAGSYRLDVPEKESSLEVIPVSPENRELPPDRGLRDLLRTLQDDESGHLIAADWLEDWAGPGAAGAALRASERGLEVSLTDAERLDFHSFGWRWLDRDVVIYLAGALRCGLPGRTGKAGFLVGLLYGSGGASRRWVRWLSGESAEAARPLARELGVELIE